MTRLCDIQGHIASMVELLDIVGAMRSLAGMRVQEAQRALPGIQRYAESVAAGIGAALLLMPHPRPMRHPTGGRRALVVCAPEHGFVGGFNERLIAAAATELSGSDAVFVLGTRGAAVALERLDRPGFSTRPMATRPAGAIETVNHLTMDIYARIARGEITRVEVIFGRYRRGAAPMIERRRLLPLDTGMLAATQPRQTPLHGLAPETLLERLIAEYVFALLTEAAVESIASENAARFAAMASAHDSVANKLKGLRQEEHQARQEEITTELLDLMTGTMALAGDELLP